MEWTKLGLPHGTNLILIAIVETVILSDKVFIAAMLTATGYWDWSVIDLELIFHAISYLHMAVNILCLCIGTIILGYTYALITWISFTAIISTSFILSPIFYYILYGYLDYHWDSFFYSTIRTLWATYILTVAIKTVSPLKRKELDAIQPVGKGVVLIWKYLTQNSLIATRFLLTVEVVLNTYLFLTRKIVLIILIFYDVHLGLADLAEECGITVIRIVMALIGIVFISKSKQTWMKIWCGVNAAILIASWAIFFYLLTEYYTEHTYFTYGYLTFYVISVGFRFVTLISAFVYSISNSHDSADGFTALSYNNLLIQADAE